MASFCVWGSTASRLEQAVYFEEAVYFSPLSSQKFVVLILLMLEGWKAESTLESPVVLNTQPLDWKSSALTTRSKHLLVAASVSTCNNSHTCMCLKCAFHSYCPFFLIFIYLTHFLTHYLPFYITLITDYLS